MRSTSLSSWVAAVKRALESKGLNASAMMQEAGLDLSLLSDPLARYPDAQAWKVWTKALAATQDPLLGLHVARHIAPSTFHALGYALLASRNLAEMFERTARYFRVVTEAGELSFTHQANWGQLTMSGHAHWITEETEPVVWCVLDCFMLTMLRTCGMLAGPDFHLLELRLQRPRPQQQELFERIFRHQPIYGSADNALVVSNEVLMRPLPFGNSILAHLNDAAAQRYLDDLAQEDVLVQLKRLLQEQLPSGAASQEKLAERLSLTPRSLQRRLADAGTTYRDFLNSVRHELALEYLAHTQHAISDIAYLLGFTEVSAFTRAFGRWMGMSPKAWRAQRASALKAPSNT